MHRLHGVSVHGVRGGLWVSALGIAGRRRSCGCCCNPVSTLLQFLAPSSVEELALRGSEGHIPPEPGHREQTEVYPDSGDWDLLLAAVGTALLGGGVLLLLVMVRGMLLIPPHRARSHRYAKDMGAGSS